MILNPNDAPFSTLVIPRGMARFLTQEEADAANLLYPVPPYGNTYTPIPPEPPVGDFEFVQLSDIAPDGNRSWAYLSPEDEGLLVGRDTITIWPIAGRAGILDDIPARAVRITDREPGRVKINLDTDGLNVDGLVLLGVIYAPA